MSEPRQGEKGSAFIVALVAVIALSGSSAALLSITLYRNREATMSHNKLVVLYIAEAGISASIAEIGADEGRGIDYDSDGLGDVSDNFADGDYSVSAVDDGNDTWTLTSVGNYKDETRRIEVVIAFQTDSPFTKAAFGGTSLDVSGVTLLDSYNSGAGSYESQATNVDPNTGTTYANGDGSVGSNGDITVSGSAEVYGDATPGPDGSTTISNNGYVSGSTAPASATIPLDPYTYTPVGSSLGLLNSTTFLSSGTYRYSEINMAASEILTLGENPGDEVTIYIDGKINMTGSAEIRIPAGVKAVMHHGSGLVTFGGNGVVNVDKTPAQFLFYSATTDKVKFSGSSAFHGAVYAPNALIQLSSADFFGSAVGESVTTTGSVNLHYDEALRFVGGSASTDYQSSSWRELDQ